MIKLTDDIELKLQNLKKSKNRDLIMNAFRQAKKPLSADDIFHKLKIKNKKLALSTVYRTLDKLIELDIIRETFKDGDKSMYELAQEHHKHYIICTNCKNIVPLDFCPFHEIEHKIVEQTGFKISGHKFEIYGECPKCHSFCE